MIIDIQKFTLNYFESHTFDQMSHATQNAKLTSKNE